jgi:hypothetical protein
MKKILFLLFIIPFSSYCQDNLEFKLKFSKKVDLEKTICISKNDYFCVETDKGLYFEYLYYLQSNGENRQIIDSSWIDGYGSTIHCFMSENNDSYVVLWEWEGEHFPVFNIYYFKDKLLIKVGEWGIIKPCKTCDYSGYYVKDIQINKRNDEIIFLFLKNVEFLDLTENLFNGDWMFIKAKDLMLSFNIIDGTLKRTKR